MPVTRSRARAEPEPTRTSHQHFANSTDEDDYTPFATESEPEHEPTAAAAEAVTPEIMSPAKPVSRIQVIVRKRPLSAKEELKDSDIVVVENTAQLAVLEHKVKYDLTKFTNKHSFSFDGVYDDKCSNEKMYKEKCQPLVQAALFDRCISTIFAFGATGSGKSYTMLGFNPSRTFTNSGIGGSSPPSGGQNSLGIYMLAANDIFSSINSQFDRLNPSSHISVYISYFEIYGNKLYDLLNDRQQLKTQVDRNENVCIIGLSELPCSDVDNLKAIVHQGNISRRTGCTGANSDSSRSHAILQIAFKNYHDMQTIGKVSFIDLAGSERGQDTIHNDKQTRMEGASINSSLLALKECIRAQDSNSKHVPFRQSQLTQVLKESFSGNCMTLMIVNISPGNSNCEQTLNSLRYASRVKDKGQGNKNLHISRLSTPKQAAAPIRKVEPKKFAKELNFQLQNRPPSSVNSKPKPIEKSAFLNRTPTSVKSKPRPIERSILLSPKSPKPVFPLGKEALVDSPFIKEHQSEISLSMDNLQQEIILVQKYQELKITSNDYHRIARRLIHTRLNRLHKLLRSIPSNQ